MRFLKQSELKEVSGGISLNGGKVFSPTLPVASIGPVHIPTEPGSFQVISVQLAKNMTEGI